MKQISKAIMLFVLSMIVCINVQAQVITEREAQEIANDFFSKALKDDMTALPQLTKVWDSNDLDSQVPDDTPSFYVFIPDSGHGFVIVSGEQSESPIIAYSFENDMTLPDELPLEMVEYLKGINSDVAMARANSTNRVSTRAAAPVTEIGNVVKYLETANWGQGSPYNQLTTNESGTVCLTGCIPTAFAIVMRYHEWPASPAKTIYNVYTYPDIIAQKDYIYNWSDMPLNNPSNEQGKAISALMQHLGHVFMVNYGTGSTSVEELNGKLSSFWGYNESNAQRMNYTDDAWIARLKEELDANRPMVYCASNSSTGDSRHAFVLDGYTDKNYFHFNWGWNGSCNGYFLLSSMIADTRNDYTQYEDTKKCHKVYFLAPNIVTTSSITVELSIATAGIVTIDNESITTKTVENGTNVTLSATANSGYEFVGWDDSNGNRVSTEKNFTVTVNSNVTYKAVFVTESTKCTVSVSAVTNPATSYGGTATASAETVASGSTVTLTATTATNFKFIGWSIGEGDIISTENPYTATVTSNTEFVAHFIEKTKYTISATSADLSMGSATVNGVETTTIYEGSPITLVATPAKGYNFAGWVIGTETVSSDETFVTTATANQTYTATFKKAEEKITIKFHRSGGHLYIGDTGTYFTSSLTVAPGTEVTIRAVPADDKEFYYWYNENDEILSNKAIYTFEVTKAQTYKTKFGPAGQNNKVTVSVLAEEGGSAQIGYSATTVSAEFYKGEEASLKAIATEGYSFVGWYVGDEIISTDARYSPIVQDATEFKAKFEKQTGIDSIYEGTEKVCVIYDLSGRRLEKADKPGIYIINGKKVLIK